MGKQEDADLILKLYDLRRETVMREARNWWFTFNPTSIQDVMTVMTGEHSGYMRMVLSYWDMACALVLSGAIDEELFNTTNGEQMVVYMKIEPVLQDLRAMHEAAAGERDHLRLQGPPVGERSRPLPCAPHLVDLLAGKDDAAVDETRHDRRELLCSHRDHRLVEQRQPLADSSLPDQGGIEGGTLVQEEG